MISIYSICRYVCVSGRQLYDDDDVTQTDVYRVTSQDVSVLTWLQRKIEEVLVDVEQQNTKTYTF